MTPAAGKLRRATARNWPDLRGDSRKPWTSGSDSVAELGNWIRYSPPPPEAKRLEPWFEDEEEEEEGGPETIH